MLMKTSNSEQHSSDQYLPIATFVLKTYSLLSMPQNAQIVAWSQNGDSFVIKEIQMFVRQVLPRHFRHGKYESFIRQVQRQATQLNMYNFSKLKNHDKPSFANGFFKRDREDLLKYIHRKPQKKKKMASDVSLSTIEKQVENSIPEPKLTEIRQPTFIIIPMQTDILNFEKQDAKQKPRRVTFRDDVESQQEQQNFSTLIKPSSKWLSKNESCWKQIKSYKSFKVSMKLLDDGLESVNSQKCMLAEPTSKSRSSFNLLQSQTLRNIS